MTPDLVPAIDPSPVPGPEWLFHGLLLLTFFIHLLFLNLTVGGTLLAAAAHLTSRGDEASPRAVLARRLVGINTYGISLTITTGVAPLLFVQLLFQQFFYSATILIAPIWMGLLLLLMIGYYTLYLHKFSHQARDKKGSNWWIPLSAAMFLLVAAIQVGVNLIHSQPDRWGALAAGSWSVLTDPVYFPRLLHFLLASIGFSAALCAWWASRSASRESSPEVNREIATYAWKWVAWTIALEVASGFLLLALLPTTVLRGLMRGGLPTLLPLSAAIMIGLAMLVMASRVREPSPDGRLIAATLGAMTVAIAFMTVTRHSVRLLYLGPARADTAFAVSPQWGNTVLFLVLFVAGIATVWYMIRRVLDARVTSGTTG